MEDGRVPGLLQNLTYFICVLITGAIVWSAIAEIRELAVAHGEVVPTGAVKAVHHLEGGIIEEVMTQEGQVVAKNTPLMRLRPTAARSDLEQLQVRAASLSLQKKRLTALLDGHRFFPGSAMKDYPRLADDQLELFKTQLSLRTREKRTFQARIDQRRSDLEALDLEAASLARQIEIKKDHVKSVEQLYKQRFSTRRSLLEARSDLEQTLSRAIALNGKRIGAREALNEARSLYLEWKAKSRKAITEELTKTSTELAELKLAIDKQADRVQRLYVRSPARGIVQFLAYRTKGEVVKPGELVARIVPVDEKIVAEVRLDPKDIGHVNIGDTAEIKISTFDPNVFGVVKGKIEKLSASTFQDERGESYYKATIGLSRNKVGRPGASHRITPGMVVQADIITGSKSMMKYLLKPVYRSLNTAFTER